jgi:hypothetical protein
MLLALALTSCSGSSSASTTANHPTQTSTAPVSSQLAATPAKGQKSAHSFDGSPKVGALFLANYPGLHICTASVVRSPGHNVIMTAAHCPQPGSGKGYAFVPNFHGVSTPYGVWHTTAGYAAAKWVKQDGNTKRDFAFFTVAPRMINGKLSQIQDVVGANRLGRVATKGEHVQITGYPIGLAGKPITCATTVFLHRGYPGSHCFGFKDGTSGGPWVAGHGKSGTVVGLISGLHQGGCTPKVVYSTPLGNPARAVLRRAERHRHPTTFPQRPSDGCPAPNL